MQEQTIGSLKILKTYDADREADNAAQEKSLKLAEDANKISEESNRIALDAKSKARIANIIAITAAISFLLDIFLRWIGVI